LLILLSATEVQMALDDYVEPEVAIAVAVTAAVASPPVRKALRKAAVYGLAGILTAGDRIAAMGREITERAKQTGAAGTAATQTERPHGVMAAEGAAQ
jgi:hypothetical protein